MNRGLLLRAFRESWPATLLLSLVLMGMEAALSFILTKFGNQLAREWLTVEFSRGIMRAMLGAEISDRMGPQIFQAIAWVHPFVLALVWSHTVIGCTRVPAGEVDRGTVDVFLGLPVSRREMFLSETVIWLACTVVLLAAALAGNLLGVLALPPADRPLFASLLPVLLNLFCLCGTVGGGAWLVSSLSNRRGRAMTVVFLLLLVFFLVNYLAQFWPPLGKLDFLNPLHYYNPLNILSTGSWPWQDIGILAGTGFLLWLAGGLIFARRDLCTV